MTTKQIKAAIEYIDATVIWKNISGDKFQTTRSSLLELKAALMKEVGPDWDTFKIELKTLKNLKTNHYDFAKALEDTIKDNE